MEQTKNFYTTADIAKLLGISRIAVFKQIKSGKIKAEKVGRNFVILAKDLPVQLQTQLSVKTKEDIAHAVSKAVLDYGYTLQKLGQE
jgi:excisionase family DNA binding protein